MDREHRERVAIIQNQIRTYYKNKVPFRIYHGSTNSTRIQIFKRSEIVDTSGLNHVLSVDKRRKIAVVESNVPMDKLVEETLQFGMLPPVITEFPGITVGGGIQGGAGESSSFRYGFLSQTINWAEYILADGTRVTASPEENADLFYGAAGSFGTLGVITSMEMQLIPSKKYVQLTYLPVDSFKSAIDTIQKEAAQHHDYIDGIMFGTNHGVIITGKLSDTISGKLQRFSRAHDPWFYLHAAKHNEKRTKFTETVPLKDYLFRYDRGAFWVGKYAFERFGIPFNFLTRFMLNPILNTRKLYEALQDSAASQEYLVQDLTFPLEATEEFMHFIDRTTGIYPLWLCPVKSEPRSPLMCNGIKTPLAINVGVWGSKITDYEKFKKLNRKIESEVARLGGKKWMYAHTYYTREEFWRIYDKDQYDKLREKYHAETLPDLFDKVRVKEHFTVNARRGLLKTIAGRARLRIID